MSSIHFLALTVRIAKIMMTHLPALLLTTATAKDQEVTVVTTLCIGGHHKQIEKGGQGVQHLQVMEVVHPGLKTINKTLLYIFGSVNLSKLLAFE